MNLLHNKGTLKKEDWREYYNTLKGTKLQTLANLMKALSHSTAFPLASFESSIILVTG